MCALSFPIHNPWDARPWVSPLSTCCSNRPRWHTLARLDLVGPSVRQRLRFLQTWPPTTQPQPQICASTAAVSPYDGGIIKSTYTSAERRRHRWNPRGDACHAVVEGLRDWGHELDWHGGRKHPEICLFYWCTRLLTSLISIPVDVRGSRKSNSRYEVVKEVLVVLM